MPDTLSHPNLNKLNQAPRKPVYHDIRIADRRATTTVKEILARV